MNRSLSKSYTRANTDPAPRDPLTTTDLADVHGFLINEAIRENRILQCADGRVIHCSDFADKKWNLRIDS